MSDAAGRSRPSFMGRSLRCLHGRCNSGHSDDGGKTYHPANTADVYWATSRNCLKCDGRVAATQKGASRNGRRCCAIAYSSDGGVTFTSPSYDAALTRLSAKEASQGLGRDPLSNPHSTSHRATARTVSDDGCHGTPSWRADGGLRQLGYSFVQGSLTVGDDIRRVRRPSGNTALSRCSHCLGRSLTIHSSISHASMRFDNAADLFRAVRHHARFVTCARHGSELCHCML